MNIDVNKAAQMQTCLICNKMFVPNKYRPNQEVCPGIECQYKRQLANMTAWRRNNPHYSKTRSERDPAWKKACAERSQEWKRENKEYTKVYRQAHKEQHREYMKKYMQEYRKKFKKREE